MRGYNFTPFPQIETERLILRTPRASDLKGFHELRSSPAVNKYLDRKPAENLEDTKAHLDKILDGLAKNEWVLWVMSLKHDATMIGSIGYWRYDEKANTADLGFEILPNEWRKGFTSEACVPVIKFAFEKIGLKAILACVDPKNDGSIAVLNRLDFSFKNNLKGTNLEVYALTNSKVQ